MKKVNLEISNFLDRFAPLNGKTICVAFSGGADSVCLLHLLKIYKEKYGYNLIAAHVNHCIRGEEAERDAFFCKNFCEENDIEFALLKVDVLSLAKQGESLEEAARRLRYKALDSIKCDLIATAHHLDDNAETLIINLLRGTGLKGMCGIPEKRDKLIRPLLVFSKEQILSYCNQQNLNFVTDSTNEQDDYTRNLIRHKIMPVLRKINPSFSSVISRNIKLFKQDEDYLDQTAEKLLEAAKTQNGLNISLILNTHHAIVSRVVRKYCYLTTKITPDVFHLEKFLEIIKGEINSFELSDGYIAKTKDNYFYFEKPAIYEYKVNYQIISSEKYKNLLKINNLLLKNAIDYDKIIGKFSIRCRKEGDKLRISGRGLTKTVRRIQQEKNIPNYLRDKMPIAADQKGVFWGYKLGTDERVVVDKNSKNILIFEVSEY